MFSLDIALFPPPSSYIRIAPRSGLARKGIDVGAGVIDADFNGKISALVINNTSQTFSIKCGDRIAQAVLENATIAPVEEIFSIPVTARGSAGWGSTGICSVVQSGYLESFGAHFQGPQSANPREHSVAGKSGDLPTSSEFSFRMD